MKDSGPPYCFDMQGKRIGMMEWAKILEDYEQRKVDFTVLDDGSDVSTVLLGLEHGRDGKGRPLIFETMVFDDRAEFGSGRVVLRYATLAEAKRGHGKVVAMLRARPLRVAKKLAEPTRARRIKIIKEE